MQERITRTEQQHNAVESDPNHVGENSIRTVTMRVLTRDVAPHPLAGG